MKIYWGRLDYMGKAQITGVVCRMPCVTTVQAHRPDLHASAVEDRRVSRGSRGLLYQPY